MPGLRKKYPAIPGESSKERRNRLKRESRRRFREANPELAKAISKKHNTQTRTRGLAKDPEAYRRKELTKNLKSCYNLELSAYEDMVREQRGVCKICGKTDSKGRRLAVDHCHETGLVRGLLCDKCNKGLGQFSDSPELVRKALEYLEFSFDPEKDFVCI